MSVVDYSFYSGTYLGTEATEASFPALCARAEDLIGAMTRWAVDDSTISAYPSRTQLLYRKAICAQADFLAINGTESLAGGTDAGFTVGNVTVQGRQSNASGGRLAGQISALAVAYLEQTGLLSPHVVTGPDLAGW